MSSKIKEKKLPIAAIIEKPGNSKNNKTGDWRSVKPVRDKTKCIMCGQCWQFCPDMAINEKMEPDYDYCKGCGICANVCPVKCIKMVKEDK